MSPNRVGQLLMKREKEREKGEKQIMSLEKHENDE